MTSVATLMTRNDKASKVEPGSPEVAEAVLAAVRELVPGFRERQSETEKLRRVPDISIRELDAAGVFKMTVPVEYGGYASTPSQIGPVFAEIARGCGSTGWVAWVTSAGAQWMTAYPHQFQEEMFCAGWVGPLQSGAMNKGGPGVGRRVPGGFMIKGQWPWASGSHHTLFHTMGILVTNEDGSRETFICQVPHGEIELLDDWFVMGMQGSGSNTIILRDELFVPEYRVISTAYLFDGVRPAPEPAGVLFAINLIQFTSGTCASLAIGMARAAIELLEAKADGKPISFTIYPDKLKAPVTHLQLGEMHCKLNAMEAVSERSLARMERDAQNGVVATQLDNARIRSATAYVCALGKEIADLALRASGASSIHLDNPIQRVMRDATTLSMHGQMNIETAYEDLGRIVAGLPGFAAPPQKKA